MVTVYMAIMIWKKNVPTIEDLKDTGDLASHLKRLRIGLLLSQEKLAMLAGVSPAAISRIEAGKGTIKTAEKVAAAMNCTVRLQVSQEIGNLRTYIEKRTKEQVAEANCKTGKVQRLSKSHDLERLKFDAMQKLGEIIEP